MLHYIVLFISLSVAASWGDFVDSDDNQDVFEIFPCNGTDKIIQIFDKKTPEYFNLVIVPRRFDIFPERVKFKVTFDSLANTTMNSKSLYYYDDSYSFEALVENKERDNISLLVQPRKDKPYPNVLSVTIDRQEICPNGFLMGVWDRFQIVEPKLPDAFNISQETNNNKPLTNFKCGRRLKTHRELILNGEVTSAGDWPWHSALYKLHTAGADLKYICGGSLFSKIHVLTAAHCVTEHGSVILPERLLVILGKYNFLEADIGTQEKTVFQIIVHPRFSAMTLENDIAVLKLTTEVIYTQYVQPICLWNKDGVQKEQLFGSKGYILGWGRTEASEFTTNLRQAQISIKSDYECLRSNPLFFSKFLTSLNFCAGYSNGTAACNGDSGGGLFIPIEDRWYLRGIVSLGVSRVDAPSCDKRFFSIFTDVSRFSQFIHNHL